MLLRWKGSYTKTGWEEIDGLAVKLSSQPLGGECERGKEAKHPAIGNTGSGVQNLALKMGTLLPWRFAFSKSGRPARAKQICFLIHSLPFYFFTASTSLATTK